MFILNSTKIIYYYAIVLKAIVVTIHLRQKAMIISAVYKGDVKRLRGVLVLMIEKRGESF